MKKPSVSILTITNFDQINLLKLLTESLEKQSYDNIKEWIIFDTNENLDNFNCMRLSFNDFILSKKIKFNVDYVNVLNIKTVGGIKNYGNTKALGDIIVWASIYDYQFSSRINTIVDRLSKSDKFISGSHNIYFYKINKQIKKSTNNNILISDTLAYKKEYCQTHNFDNTDNNYITKFTNNNSEPVEIILPENSVINIINLNNMMTSSLIKNIQYEILEFDSINYLIDPLIYKQINELKIDDINSDYLPYDIVYLTGANGIVWEPSDMKLGGSEQAVVNLSSEWAKTGYKVVVYGNFNHDV